MEITEAIATRKSIRGFTPEPVSRETLGEILEIASRAPSAVNAQPWEFFVLAGDILESIKQGNVEALHSGTPPHPEHALTGWPRDSIYRQRQVDLAKQLFQLMDIPRGDSEKTAQWFQRGFRYFDAPAAIIIVVDRSMSERAPLLDVGALMQSICLAALSYGLGTCIQDQGVMYPEVVRRYAGIPDSKRLIISIAIGHPDWDFPANWIETPRESLDRIATWCGFE